MSSDKCRKRFARTAAEQKRLLLQLHSPGEKGLQVGAGNEHQPAGSLSPLCKTKPSYSIKMDVLGYCWASEVSLEGTNSLQSNTDCRGAPQGPSLLTCILMLLLYFPSSSEKATMSQLHGWKEKQKLPFAAGKAEQISAGWTLSCCAHRGTPRSRCSSADCCPLPVFRSSCRNLFSTPVAVSVSPFTTVCSTSLIIISNVMFR